MSKFKIGDIVLVNKDTINIEGEILKIEKGSYNKENGTYILDKYYVSPINYLSNDIICYKNEITLKRPKNNIKNDSLFKTPKNATIFSYKKENVIVVGIRTEEKEVFTKKMKTSVNVNGKKVNGTFSANFKKPLKRFVIGYSICHADDEFDMAMGIEIAKKRALRKSSGELRSNSWTMLQDDQCDALIRCESEYILNNIEKYINRK